MADSPSSASTTTADLVRGLSATAQAEALKDLSEPARVLVTALDAGAGIAAGLGKPLSAVAESAVTDAASAMGDVGSVVVEVASDVAAFIPVLGPILKGVTMTVSALVSAFKGPDSGAECQSLFAVYAPKSTGAVDMPTVPADLFAPTHSVGLWYTPGRGVSADDEAAARTIDDHIAHRGSAQYMRSGTAPGVTNAIPWLSGGDGVRPMVPFGPPTCRSALGMALMQITEGSVVDVREIEAAFAESNAHPQDTNIDAMRTRIAMLASLAESDKERALARTTAKVRALWGRAIARDNRLAPLQWAHAHPEVVMSAVPSSPFGAGSPGHSATKPGLPVAWVDRFRRLRRAIESSGHGSDGGVALWIAYQDLLVSAFDRGYLTAEYVEFLFTRQGKAANKTWGAHPEWFSADPLFRRNSDKEIVASDDTIAAPPTWVWHDDPCPHMATRVMMGLVDRWRQTVHPRYAQGQERLRQLGVAPDEVDRHAREVGQRRALAIGASPAARAALDAMRARAEGSTDEQRLAALRGEPAPGHPWLVVLGALGGAGLLAAGLWASTRSRAGDDVLAELGLK